MLQMLKEMQEQRRNYEEKLQTFEEQCIVAEEVYKEYV